MSRTLSCEVLVVGLGPVGAALSTFLTDAGVEIIAIDKSTEVYPLPRAAHFDDEIMRVFQQLGVSDAALGHSRPMKGYEFRSAAGEVLVSFNGMDGLTPNGWASAYMFNQPGLERALRAKLTASPKAQLLLGAEFKGLTTRPDGVDVEIVDASGPLVVSARYVVGCDGAWSPVREAVGGKLEDLKFDEPWLVIDAIPRPGSSVPEVNLQICDPARPTTCVLMGPGRHRWEFMLMPDEKAEQVLQDDFIAGLLEKWNVDVDIERKAVYRFHGLVADQWRVGRVFIAGDAAHQTPPFAGQGMCAGIRDAANLSWKLKAVLRNQADDSLLDSYQLEREPNARSYIALAIEMGRVVCTLDPEHARMRDEQMLAARKAGITPIPPASPPPLTGPCILEGTPGAGAPFPQAVAVEGEQTLRLDDLLGPGPWLITPQAQAIADADISNVALDDPRLAPFRSQLEAWLSGNAVAAVLVRPDRYVFGAGAPDRLVEAWSAALGASAGAKDGAAA